jgi:rare lipoprotein A
MNRLLPLGVFLLLLGMAGSADARPVHWNTSVASVYDGVGLGGRVACKGYWPGGYVVAHKTLACGTRVRFLHRGRKVTARVWDRGPYVSGREFDLDVKVQRRLGFPFGVASVRWRVVR